MGNAGLVVYHLISYLYKIMYIQNKRETTVIIFIKEAQIWNLINYQDKPKGYINNGVTSDNLK